MVMRWEELDTVIIPMITGRIVESKYGYSLLAKVQAEDHFTRLPNGFLAQSFTDTHYIPLHSDCYFDMDKVYHMAEVIILRPMALSQDDEGNWTIWKSDEDADKIMRVIKLY